MRELVRVNDSVTTFLSLHGLRGGEYLRLNIPPAAPTTF